ncbi:MAG: ATP-binding protein [Desulfobacteraceae bacterium]|nr:ATP-binding protein [Desulfobacteraceae bacterium]
MFNPFKNWIVADPWEKSDINIPGINADAFELCCKAFETVRAERSTSVLLYGDQGTGKTHLLSRLRKHIEDLPQLHVFVSVRLHTSPYMFWKHVRKCLVESLVRYVENDKSLLELICLHRLSQLLPMHLKKKKPMPVPQFIEKLDSKTGLYEKLYNVFERLFPNYHRQNVIAWLKDDSLLKPALKNIEKLAGEAGLSRNLCKVLEHFLRNRHRQDAIAWLKGESLPESVLRSLHLAKDNEEMDDQEYQAKEIIKELCRLAGPSTPLVFCFDQVEAIQNYSGDDRGLFIFGQAIRSLHDETSNVLLVSCIQTFFLTRLEKEVTKPDHDALIVNRIILTPLTLEQALELVSLRLKSCSHLSAEKKDKLYSAFETDLKKYVGQNGRTAREILSYCADLFDFWETGESKPGLSDENFLNEEKAKREKQAIQDITPEKTDEIIQSAVFVLTNMDENWKRQDTKLFRDVDIILEKPGSKVGISLCNEKNMKTLTARFGRLRKLFKQSDFNLVIIRHPQLEITQGSTAGRFCLEDMKKQGAKFIKPDNEVLAALDALRSLITDASAGDLANGGRTIDNETVRDWLKKHLSGPARDFLAEVTGSDKTGNSNDFKIILDLLEQERIVRLDDAAKKLETDTDHIRNVAQQYPEQIGYLEGPPPVIFHFIPENIQTD